MAKRTDIIEWTNEYLKLHEYKDFGPMGLQFTGADEVTKIATAVSVSADIIRQAGAWGAQMLLTHHGLWWNNESRILDKRTAGRVSLAESYDMSILGYHLCLDAHPVIGNNVLLANHIGIHDLEPFGEIGWGGNITHDLNKELAFIWLVEAGTSYIYGTKDIKRAAVIAGGAPQYLTQAHEEGYDLFITGEAAEYTIYQAQELEMNFVAGGHHYTEKSGITKLGHLLRDEFSVESRFFDVENPV